MNTVHSIFALYVFLDIYTYFGLRSLVPRKGRLLYNILYGVSSLIIFYSFYQFYQALYSGAIFSNASANIHLGVFVTALIGKLFFGVLLLLQDGGRLLWGMGRFVKNLSTGQNSNPGTSFLPARRRFLTLGATALAAIPFSTMLFGITKGKYRYTVNQLKLAFKDLPPAFEGFKIVQISDIHAGSLDDIDEVARGVQLVNEQDPDLVLFTGDLVNSDKNEVDPYIEVFRQLSARHGKFSVLGNHDYYGAPDWPGEEATYWPDFYAKFEAMGFRLMNNENASIEIGTDRICLLGVENWGAGPYFPKRADLDKTLEGVREDDFCILLSHDPTHWSQKVLDHSKHIHLTLSGHTHGFQFGINFPGFKWSPAQYRYEHWMGLYEEKGQRLYVNRGFGFLGFPGRVGMWPEITVLELARG